MSKLRAANGKKWHRREKRNKGVTTVHESTGNLSLNDVIRLSHMEPDDLVEMLDRDLKRFQLSLESCCSCKKLKESERITFIRAVINIMSKVSQAHKDYKESSNTVIAEFLSDRCSTFHCSLSEYVQTVDLQYSLDTITKLCEFCKVVTHSFRDQSIVLPINELTDLSLPLYLAEQMESLAEMVKNYFRLKKQKKPLNVAKVDQTAVFENWDDSLYRTMPILPTVEEVVGKPPPLRSNIVEGSYTGWEHYFDIQFRLLREDFVAPLRRGISETFNPHKTNRITEVYIYNDVQIIEPVCTREGLCYNIKIDLRGLNLRCGLEQSKRLMFGSLLCFSPDNFQKVIYFCIVTNRDPKDIRKGILQVKFEEPLKMLPHVKKKSFLAAESKAFFEASRHVLQSLQSAEIDTMPFTRYLVLNQPLPLNPPKYLDSLNAKYNLRAVYRLRYACHRKVNIMEETNWPKSTDPDVELDQSQLDAIKMALTQEVAVIQGPPGTGKTYIGYKIVQTLLENRSVWDPHKTSPILVMCFTNHALDQFLEGIIHHKIKVTRWCKRTPKIVRIGGRSKSEEIQQFSLYNVRQKMVPEYLYQEVQDKKRKSFFWGSRVTEKSSLLQKIVQVHSDLVNESGMLRLKQYIHPSHFYQILQLADSDEEMGNVLERWLGLREEKHIKTEDKSHKKRQTLKSPVVLETPHQIPNDEEENVIQALGEAEFEEKTRKLESDDFSPLQASEMKEPLSDDALPHLITTSEQRANQKQLQSETNQSISNWIKKSEGEVNKIFDKIRQAEPLEEYTDEMIPDVTDHSFTMTQRYQLLKLWLKKYEKSLKVSCEANLAFFDRKCKKHKKADQILDWIALEQAEVIGMTTTGAAKYQHIIQLVQPKIVIVEEAAELLESHIVSALNAGTQHLILIGDHKQLRPKPNEYDLAMKHNLHISLFERLIMNGLPHATLLIQHRMRPQIASLVCPHIYDKLQNHESVTKYNNVRGFRKNMYFLNHEEKEEHNERLISHANEYEANFIVCLCRHLLKLGYSPSQVTILTAYSGQLLKLMNKMPLREFEGVKITNVDNFQGEENDIIILSLVRNNDCGSVGFLEEENRVCVALSRAREGFYCFGNFNKLLRVKVPIWDRILTQVEKEGCLGGAFPLQCPNHDDFVFEVSNPQEFSKYAPEGGCGKPCTYRLECGHTCERLCHENDRDHEKYQCKKPCEEVCSEGHHCHGYCFESPCPPCSKELFKEIPSCGHLQWMKCSDNPCDFLCQAPCEKICFNGYHQCPLLCWQNCEDCMIRIPKKIPTCGHEKVMFCYQEPEHCKCEKKCNKVICQEGHKCPKACWKECGKCEKAVLKELPNCKHIAELPCHINPAEHMCREKCTKKFSICGHLCQKTCGEKCDPVCTKLMKKTVLKCGHTQDIPCFQMPENWTCQEPCTKTLKCGHSCKGKCGEQCLLYICKEPRDLLLTCGHTEPVECSMLIKMKLKLKRGETVICNQPCSKQLACGHSCKNRCSEPCTVECQEVETKRCLKGIHRMLVVCGQDLNPCEKKCSDILPCGHPCTNKCGESCNESCMEMVDFKCPCGHTHTQVCGDRTCKCRKKCRTILECGHKCSGKCGDCFTDRIHAPCPYQVHVKRLCGHYSTVPCFGLEDKCNRTCKLVSCLHTPFPCDHLCHQSCDTECTKQCQYECPHKKCTQPCSQPCNASPCNEPCEKTLDCGHKCLGVCGERCLTKCIQCDETAFRSSVRGIDRKSKLEEISCKQYVELDCGHVFTVGFLDKHYQPQPGKDRLVSPLLCPTCQNIAICSRYTEIMKERQQEIKCIKSGLVTDNLKSVLRSKMKEYQIVMTEIATSMSDGLAAIEKRFRTIPAFDDKMGGIKGVYTQTYISNESIFALEIVTQIGKLCQSLIKKRESELIESAMMLLERVLSVLVEQRGDLSLQLINDIKKELYRSPLVEPVDIEHFSTPIVTKGQWYRCAEAGHYYFIAARYCKGQIAASCDQCHQIEK